MTWERSKTVFQSASVTYSKVEDMKGINMPIDAAVMSDFSYTISDL